MRQSILSSLALFGASALAQSTGSAIVNNQCPYDVYVFNTPAAGGGYAEQDSIIPSGGSWTQTWTQLTIAEGGWSIKLSPSTSLASILQYEYSFHDDGSIWFDLSAVNGDPWNGDWTITANGGNCTPKYAAYQYPTDDAHAMQWCPQEASISANLCGAQPQSYTLTTISETPASTAAPLPSVSATSVSVPSVTVPSVTPEAPTTYPSTTPTTSAVHQHTGYPHHTYAEAAVAEPSSTTATTPTTFATSSTVPVEEAAGVTVWEVETAVVTAVVTAVYTEAPPSRIKRHEHHGNHQHAI